ncbi:ORF6N domain-containing protein [Patescibacteria group bacterium]|nr:MAG: ORF6N domain-containing protein [Patescibacteria group bacterium]
MPDVIPAERIENKIYLMRGKKVMLDYDLAILYGVVTKTLKQSVNRNIERFPADFMFEMTVQEMENWRSQFVTSNFARMGLRRPPYVFTEQGVAMLSSVLKSKQAIAVNIQIIRTFTKLREMVADNQSLRLKLEALEKHYDEQFRVVFDAIRRLLATDDEPKPEIGFKG